MHKLKITYGTGSYYMYGGYLVQLTCSMTGGGKDIACFKQRDDALKYAEWKAMELGLGVDDRTAIKEVNLKKKKRSK